MLKLPDAASLFQVFEMSCSGGFISTADCSEIWKKFSELCWVFMHIQRKRLITETFMYFYTLSFNN